MANQRQRQLMQEALDETLSPDALHELQTRLDRTPDDAHTFNRLKQVDRVLRAAPMERAPHTLALNIMAKLAEGLQQRAHNKISGLALALALALLAAALMPLLIGFGWLIMGLLGNPAALGNVLNGLASVLASVSATLDSLVASAQRVVETYPEAPALVVAVIPISLLWLVRTARQHRGSERQRSAESRLADANAPMTSTAEVRAASERLGQRNEKDGA
ncbi:MAG: hypothetical protein SGI73_19450 [Chloroflexota bacterium]|nr:hypothetical protein [Chloroflexota bacterium]